VNKMPALSLLASASLLGGCANLANYQGGLPPTQKAPLEKTSFGQTETLAQAGLVDPQTVWIPWYYTKTGDALYIHGTRFSVPGVGQDAPGFLDTPTGYLVVLRSRAKNLRLQADQVVTGPEYLFYQVSHTGKVIRLVGSVEDHSGSNVVVDRKAIYIANPVGDVSGNRIYNYVGYSINGHRKNGPQNVLFAAPEQSGGWSLMRVTKPNTFSTNCASGNNYEMQYVWANEDKGNFHILRKSYLCDGSTQLQLFPRGNVVVDEPNYASSVTTGYFLRVNDKHPALTNHIDWFVSVMNPDNKPKSLCWGLIGRECVQETSQYAAKIGSSNTNVGLAQAGGVAVSSSIFSDATGHPSWSTQINERKGFSGGALYYGYVSMLPGGHTTEHPVFKIMGGFLNTFRNFVTIGAGNDADYDMNGEYQSVNIVAPGHVIMVPAGQAEHSSEPVGYDVVTGKKLTSGSVLSFLSQYGIQS